MAGGLQFGGGYTETGGRHGGVVASGLREKGCLDGWDWWVMLVAKVVLLLLLELLLLLLLQSLLVVVHLLK